VDVPWVVRIWPAEKAGYDSDEFYGPFSTKDAALQFFASSSLKGNVYPLDAPSTYVPPLPDDRMNDITDEATINAHAEGADGPRVVRVWTLDDGPLDPAWSAYGDDAVFGPFSSEKEALTFLTKSGREGSTYKLETPSA
jgi:hypothetical protein